MNRKQKILTAIALLALLISAENAPWIYIHPGSEVIGDWRKLSTTYAPLWNPPDTQNAGIGDECHLNTVPLLCTWALIAIIYSGLFVVLKSKPKTIGEAKGQKFTRN